MKLKVPGSYWAWGQIFHSCTPNTKTTFILSLPPYFRCLKQNSPLSHAHWVSLLLLFALLLWAEPVGFPLKCIRQHCRSEIFSMIPRGKEIRFLTRLLRKTKNGHCHWNIHLPPASKMQAALFQPHTWKNRKCLETNFIAWFCHLTKILSAHFIIKKQTNKQTSHNIFAV